MLLEDKYYRIAGRSGEGHDVVFRIALVPDCEVYRGHFPGRPVCPGACHIQLVKECAMRQTGKRLAVHAIRQCRLTAVATPLACRELLLRLQLEADGKGCYAVTARMSGHDGTTYMEYKGEMHEV